MMINQDKKIEPEVFQKSGAGASQNRSFVIRFAEQVEDYLFQLEPEPNFDAAPSPTLWLTNSFAKIFQKLF